MMPTWISIPKDSDFPLENLPFGVFQTPTLSPRVGIAIGEYVLDLHALAASGLLNHLDIDIASFSKPFLNDWMRQGKQANAILRAYLQELLSLNNSLLRDNLPLREEVLHKQSEVEMCLPILIGDYTDFYSSEEHATNVGIMFRGKENALMPNWKHLPVGYHGRASSIVVSGVPLHRPKGQMRPNPEMPPVFGYSKQIDFELEMGFVIGKSTALGDSISTQEAEEYIFGMCLFNDWSARDIQAWEYVPLGPFLGKNFGSSISPWIVTMEALAAFKVEGKSQSPEVLPYLQFQGKQSYDIHLSVELAPENAASKVISRSNHKYLYWNIPQQLAHHTINGCNVNVGDLMASGTISGPTEDSYGSMLELAWRGTKPLTLPNGETRTFIQDNDTVTLRGYCEKEGLRIGFGEVKTKILAGK